MKLSPDPELISDAVEMLGTWGINTEVRRDVINQLAAMGWNSRHLVAAARQMVLFAQRSGEIP